MITWTSKSLALAAALGLAACGDVEGPGILAALSDGATTQDKAVALSETQMANGSFTLIPPQGFCIDRRSLRQTFALMARCDALGAPSRAAGAPVGVITVSVTKLKEGAALPTSQHVADAAKLARITAEQTGTDTLTFQAEGVPPTKDLDVKHWRGMARINGSLLGVALYGPEDGRAVSAEGREVIDSLISRTRAGS